MPPKAEGSLVPPQLWLPQDFSHSISVAQIHLSMAMGHSHRLHCRLNRPRFRAPSTYIKLFALHFLRGNVTNCINSNHPPGLDAVLCGSVMEYFPKGKTTTKAGATLSAINNKTPFPYDLADLLWYQRFAGISEIIIISTRSQTSTSSSGNYSMQPHRLY